MGDTGIHLNRYWRMVQLLPGLRIKVSNKHSTYGRVKVKTIQLFLG
jgi:hypothetical protein